MNNIRANCVGCVKKAFVPLFVLGACFAAVASNDWPAANWYVDDDAPEIGADGSIDHPFPTIQQAINSINAASQTIYVAEGVYSSGETQLETDGVNYARVYVNDANNKRGLRIIGAGRDKSIIVGSRDPSATGFVEKSKYVCCMRIKGDRDIVIQGFTLRDGEANVGASGATIGYGGGLYATAQSTCLVDCDIVHCAAGCGGAMQSGTAVRCLLKDNYGNSGPAVRSSRLINCIVTGTGCSTGSRGVLNAASLYNCTVIDNKATWTAQGSSQLYNSILALNSNSGVYYRETNTVSDVATDSVLASQAPKGFMQIAGPAVGDYRPLADSDAVAAGVMSHLTALSLPPDVDALKDFNGRTIEADANGRINAGAIQEIFTPAGGALVLKDGQYEVNGHTNLLSYYSWVYPETYPTQYCVRVVLAEGEHLYRVQRFDPLTGGNSRDYPAMVPYRDGTMWMMPPVDPGICITNTLVKAVTVLYVDPNEGVGSNTTGDGTENNPYATIQYAMGKASGATVIYLKPGEYANDVQDGGATRGNFRIYQTSSSQYIRLVSTEGAARTIIRGRPDPEAADGLGPGAIKGVFLNKNTILQDVTVADCYTDTSGSANSLSYGAALFFNSNLDQPPQVIDCVITNCHAAQYVSVNYGVLRRCRFYDCTTLKSYVIGDSAGTRYNLPLFSCYSLGVSNLVTGSGTAGIVGGSARIYQCTFTGIIGSGRIPGTDNASWNSIWYGGWNIYSGSVFTNCFVYKPTGTAIGLYEKTDPLFVDVASSGELCANSPAIGAGLAPANDAFGDAYWKLACGDIDGRPIVFDENGRPTLGAFQYPKAVVRVTAEEPADGGWEFADGHDFGQFNVSDGETLSVTAAEGRSCLGVTCGDRPFLFAEGQEGVASIPYSDLLSGGCALAPVYVTEFHVDDRNGNDGNSGYTAAAAKKTLATAAALLYPGDTLWVHPGHYATGAALHNDTLTLQSRVVVKDGTSVVSTDGPEETFIIGAAASIEPDDYGCGTNAIRCAYVGKNSRLSGFTLTGGHVNRNVTTDDEYGSAVCGYDRDTNAPVVENCIISNNVAALGTVYKCNLFGCRVVGNTTTSHGCGVRQANAFGCYFDKNQGSSVFNYARHVWNCTATRGNTQLGKNSLCTSINNTLTDGCVRNSFFGGIATESSAVNYDNCVVHRGSTFSHANVVTNFVQVVDTNTQSFDTDGVPVIGANVCVDAGDASLNTNALGNVDLRGFQRIMNGRMDIGCFEADWRGLYAKSLCGKSIFSVTAADPQVVLEEGEPLTVREGTLAAEWANESGSYRTYGCGVQVTGTGSLAVTLNGETFATIVAADGARRLEFKNAIAANALEFTYTPGENDEGFVVLRDFTREGGGFIMKVR